ncbi:hypothetical protein NA57DRAFT_74061 [Rhizodiscina lignyota]|uniref:Uncharacterized protein n=1 Tax=Rhizodiscina lignyota TaxID=1504668 RepID=A0A9P4MAK3_9PEZI|nr:hypothetical protein NA57DRAFT_74061 [Rhizodiscina lignyota]
MHHSDGFGVEAGELQLFSDRDARQQKLIERKVSTRDSQGKSTMRCEVTGVAERYMTINVYRRLQPNESTVLKATLSARNAETTFNRSFILFCEWPQQFDEGRPRLADGSFLPDGPIEYCFRLMLGQPDDNFRREVKLNKHSFIFWDNNARQTPFANEGDIIEFDEFRLTLQPVAIDGITTRELTSTNEVNDILRCSKEIQERTQLVAAVHISAFPPKKEEIERKAKKLSGAEGKAYHFIFRICDNTGAGSSKPRAKGSQSRSRPDRVSKVSSRIHREASHPYAASSPSSVSHGGRDLSEAYPRTPSSQRTTMRTPTRRSKGAAGTRVQRLPQTLSEDNNDDASLYASPPPRNRAVQGPPATASPEVVDLADEEFAANGEQEAQAKTEETTNGEADDIEIELRSIRRREEALLRKRQIEKRKRDEADEQCKVMQAELLELNRRREAKLGKELSQGHMSVQALLPFFSVISSIWFQVRRSK